MIRRVAIIGVGLMGSSLGLALQGVKGIEEIIGIDKNIDYLQESLDIGAIDKIGNLREGVKGVDLLVFATPVGVIKELLVEILPFLDTKTIITDVGSIKSELSKEIEEVIGENYIYIGGHPMTGAESAGPSGADKYLFENAIYILTQTKETDVESLDLVRELVERIGAQVLILSPKRHDRIVAITSHLPHLIAVNLMDVINSYYQEDRMISSLIAGGFRDTTRIAAGDPIMWRDIFLKNKDILLETIDSFSTKLNLIKELIFNQRSVELTELLTEVRSSRINLPMRKKGLLLSDFEVIVTLEDKPNSIGRMATLLGKENVNIQDLEILKVRDQGGTIRLSFAQSELQERAYQLLKKNGYKAILK